MAVRYDDLVGKKVLVTGGTSGLGFAIAKAFAANGATVVVVGRNAERLASAGAEIGGTVVPKAFDLNDIERLPELVADITTTVGEIDVLVNNAGINMKKPAVSVSNADFLSLVQTNQVAVFALAREVAKPMIARGAGNIIMISSMAAHFGLPGVVAYSASKSAVEGMTRQLCVEWSPLGLRVNCIAPGFIQTPMSTRAFEADPARKARVMARTPMGHFGVPADIGNAALFLASEASSYISGTVLRVDGGSAIGF
jgi:NAD(P)-dependent dehydrogenase (short-subunit alcohol dehydrogenase family)